ncbi:hypothetical protein E2C01_078831 [Portunus trituberculatus]|uniref:Uncharacterized protein n=1 Tax=Portunus trituberculatus TaxID=210409 RepID=A0A5B7IV67_PORTR|nr:hypothetical protein [Portunus trituberculatus]
MTCPGQTRGPARPLLPFSAASHTSPAASLLRTCLVPATPASLPFLTCGLTVWDRHYVSV